MIKEIIQLHAVFHGRVQGIGFRWTVVDYGNHFKLTGTAKNLLDGTVEVYAQGTKDMLESFIEAIKNDSGFARIDSVSCQYQKVTTSFQGFHIVY